METYTDYTDFRFSYLIQTFVNKINTKLWNDLIVELLMTCSKLFVTKAKYNKGLQSQRTKGQINTSFDFTVILWKYVSKIGI